MKCLVIGIGNTLRRDDGLGPWLAERIAAWRRPGIATRSVHQLTPELAIDLANYDRVLFVDASEIEAPRFVDVRQGEGTSPLGHLLSPYDLVALADRLDERRPEVWLVPVRGTDFGFGDGLSAEATAAGESALLDIEPWLLETETCTK